MWTYGRKEPAHREMAQKKLPWAGKQWMNEHEELDKEERNDGVVC